MRWSLLILTAVGLFANPIEDLSPSSSEEIASLRTNLNIGGYVNPLSGQISFKTEDLRVRGAQDVVLTRMYVPPKILGKYEEKDRHDKYELALSLAASKTRGWVVFPHLWCGVNAKSSYFQVPDGSGFVLEFKRVGQKWLLATLPHGMSNLANEEPSSASDLRNTRLEVDDQMAKVITPNGTQRIYAKMGPEAFRLEKEILPNGKAIRYEYSRNGLAKVSATDHSGKYVYGFIDILGSGRYQGSDGTEAQYSYELRTVEGSNKKRSAEYTGSLLTRVGTAAYSHSIGYNQRYLLEYYDDKSYPIHCEYTNRLHAPAQIERLKFPIGSYSFSYDHPIAGQKEGFTTVVHPSGAKTIYRFDRRLLLTAIENWNERLVNQKLFHYNEKQQIVRIETKDGAGNVLLTEVFECDEAGNALVETWIGDFGTFTTRREFSQNRLVREENDDGLGYSYTYLGDTHLLTSKTTLDHGVPVRKTTFEYDESCNLLQERSEGKTIVSYTLRDRAPHLHRIEWREERDWEGQLIRKTKYSYDYWGNISREEIFGSDDEFAYSIERTYNQKGELLAETNPIGQTASFEYDARGRLIREIPFSRKIAIDREYDTKGRLTLLKEGNHATLFGYNDSDLLTQKTDYLGFTTRYSYDPVHQKPIEIDAAPQLTRIVYDSFGREITRSDAYGNTQTTRYNSNGDPLEIVHPSGGKERFEYASNGSLKSHVDADGVSTIYARDTFGRITSRAVGDAKTVYQYDAYELIQEIDPEGVATDFVYDLTGRQIKKTTAGRETAYTYDSLGNLAKIQQGQRSTEFKRDLLGRILQESVGGIKTSWTYDEAGNVATITKGGTTSFLYDEFNRRIEKNDSSGSRSTILYEEGQTTLIKRMRDSRGVESIEFYDPHGLLRKREIPGVQLQEFDYDSNLKRVRFDHLAFSYSTESLLTSVTEAGQRITSYTHSPAGRIQSKRLPDGQILEYSYNSQGLVSRIGDQAFEYDLCGRYIGGTGFQRKLDPFGNILREDFGNGLWIESKYDEFNRPILRILSDRSSIRYAYDSVFLQRVERINPSGIVVYTHSYDEYDAVGNLVAETHRSPVRYSYDEMNRLTHRKDEFLDESCQYDPVGNLLQKGNKSYSYDDLSQIIEEFPNGFKAHYDGHYNRIEWNDSPVEVNALNELVTEKYDANGNLIRSGYDYNAHGRLIRAGGQNLVYDALGRRLSKGDTAFLYIGNEEIGAFQSGKPKELQIPGLRRAVAIEIDSVLYIPVYDIQNTIRRLIDWQSGNAVEQNDADVFGLELNSKIPYSYMGKRFDEDIRLFYFGQRYYDPKIGRWLTPDPVGAINSSNLYQFVYNNPLLYVDNDGQFAFAIPLLILGAEMALPALSTLAVPLLWGAATGAAAYGTYKLIEYANTSNEPPFQFQSTGNTSPTDTFPYNCSDYMTKSKGTVDPNLPANPDELLKRPGWKETTHPEAGKRGHRTFDNESTGEQYRHDQGRPGATGHEAEDHYHHLIPDGKGGYEFLDGTGKQVPKGSDPSHIYPGGRSL